MVKLHGMAQTIEIAEDGREVSHTDDAQVGTAFIYGMTEKMDLDAPLQEGAYTRRFQRQGKAVAWTRFKADARTFYRRHPLTVAGLCFATGAAAALCEAVMRKITRSGV
jgi:hypothetical protein